MPTRPRNLGRGRVIEKPLDQRAARLPASLRKTTSEVRIYEGFTLLHGRYFFWAKGEVSVVRSQKRDPDPMAKSSYYSNLTTATPVADVPATGRDRP